MTEANLSAETFLGRVDDFNALLNSVNGLENEQTRDVLNYEMGNVSEAIGATSTEIVAEQPKTDLDAYKPERIRRFIGAITPERMKGKGRKALACAVAGVVALGASTTILGCSEESPARSSAATGESKAKDNAEKSGEQEADLSFKKNILEENERKRWLKDGFAEIRQAKTKKESRAAVDSWLDAIKGDPATFKFVFDKFTDADKDEKIDKSKLFDGENSTDYAEAKLKELKNTLLLSSMKKGDAKSIRNPHNTGFDDGKVTIATNPGVHGNTEAVIVTLPNGERVAIMARCAQPVVEGKPTGVPTGPTDNPPPRKREDCPPGYIMYRGVKCVHPRADGPPRGVSQRPYNETARPTPGYPGRGNAERVVNRQESEKPKGVDPTPYGTPGDTPDPSQQIVSKPPQPNPVYNPNVTSPGTNQGVTNPEQTEGSGTTSGPGSDPGLPK